MIQSIQIISPEEQNIGTEEIKRDDQRVSTNVLAKLAEIYEKSGAYADAYIQSMSKEFDVDVYMLANNLQVLEDLGYIESVASGCSK